MFWSSSRQIGALGTSIVIMGMSLVVAYFLSANQPLDAAPLILLGVFWFGMCWVFAIAAAQGQRNWTAGSLVAVIIFGSIAFAVMFVTLGFKLLLKLLIPNLHS